MNQMPHLENAKIISVTIEGPDCEITLEGMFMQTGYEDAVKAAKEASNCNVYTILKTYPNWDWQLTNQGDMNPNARYAIDKGVSQIIGYLIHKSPLNPLDAFGDTPFWLKIIRYEVMNMQVNEISEHVDIDALPNETFIISWLAAGNMLIPELTNNDFEKWLNEAGVSINKRISIMRSISLRSANIELFDSALKHHLDGLNDKERNRVLKHFNNIREHIKKMKMWK